VTLSQIYLPAPESITMPSIAADCSFSGMAKRKLAESLIPTLPGAFYVDQAIFRAEQSAVFGSAWICTARASDLAEAGSFQTFDLGGESVIVSRDQDDRLQAFLNICRHRGSRICTETDGRVGRNFQCPYHAWSYTLDGRLAGAPNLASMPDIDPAEFGLISVHLREWLGYAWLCLAATPPSFEDSIQSQVTARFGDPAMIDQYGLDRLALGRRIEYDVKANWKLIVENFMECYHCATLHPELVTVLPEFKRGYATQDKVGYGAAFGEGIRGFTFDGREGFARLEGLADDQDRRYYGMTVMPQTVINLAPDHVIFHRIQPLAVDRTIVRCDWLFEREVVASGADVDASVELFHRVNQQDFGAVEACQPAMSSRGYAEGGVFVPAEHHIAGFHSWLREQLA
jgi:Rieske 2Fe-2S family protein